MTTIVAQPMAWTNERLKYSSNDCIGLKSLWKMLILDNHSADINTNEVGLFTIHIYIFLFKTFFKTYYWQNLLLPDIVGLKCVCDVIYDNALLGVRICVCFASRFIFFVEEHVLLFLN